VGHPKATVAAEFIMKRVPGVKVTPSDLLIYAVCKNLKYKHHRYFGKIQDKDDDYYLQFNLVICGLDSVEARRWMNATLVSLVDPENPESLKPMIDGGTEGLYLYFLTLTTPPDDCCRV
jgi:ubiquitin-activating enzyme E1 C